MDYGLTEELKQWQLGLRELVEAKIKPHAASVDESGRYPWESVNAMAGAGLFGLTTPKEYGGQGKGYLALCLAAEELGRGDASCAVILSACNIFADTIRQSGTEAQKKKYIPPVVQGKAKGTISLTEYTGGSDVSNMQTTAVPVEDVYEINGAKHFAGGIGISDYYLVAAMTDRAKGVRGISLFLIDKETPGLEFVKVLPKMALLGQPHGDIMLRGCRVPKENLLGQLNGGIRALMAGMNAGRLLLGAACVGTAQAAFEEAVRYAGVRQAFGKTLSEHQAIQFMLADMCVELETSRLLVYQTGRTMDEGKNVIKECAMVKVYASEMAKRIVDTSLQIHGAAGYLKGNPLERYYREIRGNTIAEGTSEIMRITIARQIIKEASGS